MKRILFILFSLVLVSSCFDDGSGMGQSYTVSADFNYMDIEFFPDSTFFNTRTTDGFGYDALNFYHQLDPGKIRVDGGFILSRLEMPLSGKTEGLNNTYRCYLTGLKSRLINTYTVFHYSTEPGFMPKHAIGFPFVKNGTCHMHGCFVTNTVEVAEYVKANFEVGDRLTLKATGYLDGVKTGEAEIHLADYSAAKDSIVSLWTPFELTKLGSIEHVDFELISTKDGVPPYFCMDNMVFKVDITY